MVAKLGLVDVVRSVGQRRLLPLLLLPTSAYEEHQQNQHNGGIHPELDEEVHPTNLNSETDVVGELAGRNDVRNRLTTPLFFDHEVAL